MDADLEQLSKKRADANAKTLSTGKGHNSFEKASNSSLCKAGQIPNGEKGGSTSSEDHIRLKELTHDIHLETQLAESEQATYASANNDLKGTKAYQEADVPGLYNLAMAIIDYRGHRVVAQVCSEAEFHL